MHTVADLDSPFFHAGKLTVLDLANNAIGARGASQVAEYIKKSKSLLLISLYMNDIGDEVHLVFCAFIPKFCHFCRKNAPLLRDTICSDLFSHMYVCLRELKK